jgi:hypothetical protein
MPISASDINFYYSGGANNSDPKKSLGGDISNIKIPNNTLHNLFDIVTSDQSQNGITDYRCIYVRNDHATLTLMNSKVYISANTPDPDTTILIGLGIAGIGSAEPAISNENTKPSGVIFSSPEKEQDALTIGDIPPKMYKAIWLQRVVNPGSKAFNNDGVALTVFGDTAA